MRIYLDHNATTPLRPEVLEAMSGALAEHFGNPSSTHAEGAAARAAVGLAREQVAGLLRLRSSSPDSIVFTSGATEANNALLRFGGWRAKGSHVVTTTTEHPSVLEPLGELEGEGVQVTRLPVDAAGLVDVEKFVSALGPDTGLVSVIWANNETGVLQPISELVAEAKSRGILVHVDATQALGKCPIDVEAVPVDFLSASAHKLNGPKGTGCLYARDRELLSPWWTGGGQEAGMRGGTENVAGVVGFGVACALAEKELDARIAENARLRDLLWEELVDRIPDVRRNGLPDAVLSNTLNVEFCGTPGEIVLQALDLEGIAVSAGAACHSGAISPSHVLTAMGRSAEQARSCLRFSVGHGVDETQIQQAGKVLREVVPRARQASPSA